MTDTSRKDGDQQRHEVAFDHAWRYFALHSEQRTTVFNFFVASSGLTLSGLGYVLATDTVPRYFGLVAGLGAALLAFTFWKLDQRVGQLIKTSERVMIGTEHAMLREQYRLMSIADEAPVNLGASFVSSWSYGRSFRTLFLVTAIMGLAGAGTSLVSMIHVYSGSAATLRASTKGTGHAARKDSAGSSPVDAAAAH
jgi:hypothetical protein